MSSLTPAPSSLSRTSFLAIPSAFSKFQLCPLPSVPSSSSSSSSSRVLCRGGSSVQHVATDFKLVLHDALDASGIDTTHARKAREEFCSQIRRFTEIEKETSICINRSVDLGRTALYIAAEDDSLVSHSSVPLPVDAFISRLDDLSMDYCPHYKPEYDSSPEKFLESIERFLYVHKGFSRANENLMELRPLYLHSVLTHRSGSAVMLSLIYSEIMKMLRLWGLLYFDAEIFFPHDALSLPNGYHKQKSKESDQVHIMTSGNLLVKILNNLKHAFWPFQHDSNKSLFLRAAHAANCVDRSDFVGESGSQIASAKAAQHRLDRGVWTSVRFGDMRRSLSACERLILMNNNDANEFRDYSILLYHCGLYEQSLQYLNKYQELKKLQAEVNSSDPLSSLEDDAADKLMMRLNLIMMEQGWSQPPYARNFLGNSSEPW
ncbi:uncharacterized protein LOC130955531 [Arachis stenosperma]|uniref:uncharacterized protein LOC130955531 n=1 Tax=Arachis stenosperma TaxID=217475 RepID=UPI0025AB9A8A|nr:uncharacterized protein LOC130955531 [Arachis stenosperma]